MNTKYTLAIGLLVIVIIGGLIFLRSMKTEVPADPAYVAFAECLSDAGATFYGAFWCPHCQSQKAMFGKAATALPYVECSTPDGQSQLPICTDAGVESYPTWEFSDGTRLSGEQQLSVLSEKTGCALPTQ